MSVILKNHVMIMAFVALPAWAQTVPSGLPAPAEMAHAITLGTGGVPGALGPEQWSAMADEMSVRNVASATLLPVLPDPRKATGAAVVVAPGGGFATLSWDHEGIKVARVMADYGIAAFVLKYRLDPTPRDAPSFAKAMTLRMTNWIGQPGGGLKIKTPPYAVEDATAALRYVREHAAQWHIDRARVGMLGFSAGARTTLAAALQAPREDRADFIGLLYPPMGGVKVPEDAPPMFIAMAADDPLFGHMGYGLLQSWVAARRPVEFHLYQAGGHGFGLGYKDGTTAAWPQCWFDWMAMNHFLRPAVAQASAPQGATVTAYSTASTPIGVLMDDPTAKAIVERHMPGLTKSEQIAMARAMTLKAVQQYAPDTVTDAKLAAIDAEFAKLHR